MEFVKGDWDSVLNVTSHQQLSSSPEFSTIMNVMRFAQKSLSRNRQETLQVPPEIKVTLASEARNRESDIIPIEAIQNTDCQSSKKSITENSREERIKNALWNQFEEKGFSEERIERAKRYQCKIIGRADQYDAVKNKQDKLWNERKHIAIKSTRKDSKIDSIKPQPIEHRDKNMADFRNGTSLCKDNISGIVSVEESKRRTEKQNADPIKTYGRKPFAKKESTSRELKRMKEIENKNGKSQVDLYRFHQQTTRDRNHNTKQYEHSNKPRYVNKTDKVEPSFTKTNPLAFRGFGNYPKPSKQKYCSCLSEGKKEDGVQTNSVGSLYKRLHKNNGNCWSATKIENVSGMCSTQKTKVKQIKTVLSRRLSRSDSELTKKCSEFRSDTMGDNRTTPEKMAFPNPMNRRNSFTPSNGASDYVPSQGCGYSISKSTMTSNNPSKITDNYHSRHSVPRATALPPLRIPTVNCASSVSASVPSHLTPPVERRSSCLVPQQALPRSKSWSNLRALSRVLSQINDCYSKVTSRLEVADVNVDDVLKSWNVQYEDINVIRRVVQRPQTDAAFTAADNE